MGTHIPMDEAIAAYKYIHELNLEKRLLTKAQKEAKETVKAYLQDNPEGFYVELEDLKEKVRTYQVTAPRVDRTTVDKTYLRNRIKEAMEKHGVTSYHIPANINTSYLARLVEQGYLEASIIEDAEDTTSSQPIKKKRATRPEPATVGAPEGVQAELDLSGATMTVHRGDGSVELHRPTVIQNGEVIQEGSVERLPDEEPGGRWAV